ncbi:MAG: phenylalanine--tRNA ligase beta subunit-related protein [Oscillospiraceae bacterium]
MKFYVTEEVFEKMPNACFGLVSVWGLDNGKSYPHIEKLLTESIKSCEEHFEGKVVKQEKELLCYRDAFLQIGINPNKFMSSIEALLTRISKKKGLPEINPVVDLGNAISLKYYLPVGAQNYGRGLLCPYFRRK